MSSKSLENKEKKADSFKHGEMRKIVISAIGLGILIGGIMITPNFPIVLGTIMSLIEGFTEKKISKRKVKRVLQNLEKKEFLYLERKNKEVYVYLKNFFNPIVLKYSLQALFDLKRKSKQWKRKWYMVMFDVPETQRNKRVYLRSFLKEIGFFPYQKSVYIFPYECEKEIALIKKIVESGKYLSYVVAEKIEQEEKVKIHFGL